MQNVALVHANVITVDSEFSFADAVWIKNGRIEGVGTSAQIEAAKDGDTDVIDLNGKTVMPGFIDTHGHIALFGLDELKVNLEGAHTRASIIERIAQAAKAAMPGEWLITTPIGTSPYFLDFEAIRGSMELPSREELDFAVSDNLVYITALTNPLPNSAILNSRALTLANITQ